MTPVLVEIDGRPAHFTPEMKKREMTLGYTEPVDCPYCGEKTVRRESDLKYSIKKNRKVNIVGKNDWPIFVDIDVAKTKRDEFGNYCDGVGGEVVPHVCNTSRMELPALRGLVKNLLENYTKLAKLTMDQDRKLDEETLKKPYVVEWQYEY
jgi:hypothetical protein